jgi:hypothetical protein
MVVVVGGGGGGGGGWCYYYIVDSRDNYVSIVTSLRPTRPRNQCSIPCKKR